MLFFTYVFEAPPRRLHPEGGDWMFCCKHIVVGQWVAYAKEIVIGGIPKL